MRLLLLCYGLNCIPPKMHMLKSQSPRPQNVTVLEDGALKKIVMYNRKIDIIKMAA